MFDGLANTLTSNALTDQVTSFLGVPVIAPLVLAPVAVALVVIGARGIRSLLGRRH